MARAIEQIERDIAALKEAIGAIALELQRAYGSYLSVLGPAVRQQLILASYYLSTQGYPENFLRLSLNQRQQLQQAIRKLGQQAADKLLAQIRSEEEEESERVGDVFDDAATQRVGDAESENVRVSPLLGVPMSSSPDLSNPMELAMWQQNLEDAIAQTLKAVSRDGNRLLQQAGILPKKLPEPILEAAMASSESAEVMPGPPNLLNLVIEIENEQHLEESGLTQIMAINLRLGEIEFADATLSSGRKLIRGILVQLNKLGREYQNKQRERSIAEAESAWRASWFED